MTSRSSPADDAALLVRAARKEAGLTQQELARRLATTQPAIARLERPGANPRLSTVRRVLRATGRRLVLDARPVAGSQRPDLDEEQIRTHLAMTPAERLAAHSAAHRNVGGLVRAARGGRELDR